MAALFTPHPDVSMRPGSDKELSTIDLDRIFDQYVETESFQHFSCDSTTGDPASSDHIDHLFELPLANGSEPFATSAFPSWESNIEGQSRHKAAHNIFEEQNPASPDLRLDTSFVYPQSGGKACFSDPEIFSFDDSFDLEVNDQRATSQPSTPVPQDSRPNTKKTRASPDRSTGSLRHGIRKPSKKSSVTSLASKMMNPSHYRAGFQDLWARKIDTAPDMLSLQLPANGIHSPPPSTKLAQEEHVHGFFPREHPYTIAMSPPLHNDATSDMHASNYQLTPSASPAIDMNSRNNSNAGHFQFSSDAGMTNAYISHHLNHAALSALQHTPPPSQRLSMGAWGSETSPNLDFSDFGASPDFQSPNHSATKAWWTGNNNAGVSQPSTPNTQHPQHQQHFPQHSRNTSQSMSFTNPNTNTGADSAVAGLGISCETASFPGFTTELPTSHTATNGASQETNTASSSFDMVTYGLYNAPPTPGIPIGTGPARPPSRSATPSPQPYFTRRRHSQNPLHNPNNPHHHHHQQNRHASIASSRRKSSIASNGSAQTHPRAPSNGNVGFVNYTPNDSRKILTGVAPSGSSKTKARREKEAAEKRRKLSQVAFQAVKEAGGDVDRLRSAGFLALE